MSEIARSGSVTVIVGTSRILKIPGVDDVVAHHRTKDQFGTDPRADLGGDTALRPIEAAMPKARSRITVKTRSGKFRKSGHILNPKTAHDIAEIFPGIALLQFLPLGWVIDIEFSEHTDEDGVLVDAGMTAQLVRKTNAPLLVEG